MAQKEGEMEPFSALLAKKAIDVFLAKVESALGAAAEKSRGEVERCSKYLEACSFVVQGLEAEYDEILVQAQNCPDDRGAIADLKLRIEAYLTVDKLRTKLIDAIEGLSGFGELFAKSANSLLNWPWRVADKWDAVENFRETLTSVRTYLQKLSDEGLPHRPAGSGVGQEALHALLRHIETPAALRQSSLAELAERFRGERDKEPMFAQIRQIRGAIESLQQAFF